MLRGDRGSITVYTAVFTIVVIFLLGLIVDGGIAMNARERAADIAAQAARAASDDIDLAALRGGVVRMAPGACGAANTLVDTYARADAGGTNRVMNVTDTCVHKSPTIARVTVTVIAQTLVPGRPGPFTESATQTATVQCGTIQGATCP